MEWRQEFVRTFLERDLPSLGISVAADTTVRSYLDKLTDALVVRQLKPRHENLGKRQVKAPKIHIRDSVL